jgi:hypothetical protein
LEFTVSFSNAAPSPYHSSDDLVALPQSIGQ